VLPPVAVTRGTHRCTLKWHRARRRASDPVFTGRRIVEGMQAGASVEVDLVVHGGEGFAVLHNLDLARETTGTGLVRNARAETLRGLHLRANDGTPLADPVLLLEDLAALLAREGTHPDGRLQLDYKEDAAALTPRARAIFAEALGPVAASFILSGGDAEAVRLLSEDVPGLRLGYDPCHMCAIQRLQASRDYAGFVSDARTASPGAEMIYLEAALVLFAADDGFDLIAAFHAQGQRVDAYTIRRADAAGIALAERLLELEADQITTDDPEGLAAALGG
jgi:glycerophosphoryl diester phosphodiesterase